jgi:rubredoxin
MQIWLNQCRNYLLYNPAESDPDSDIGPGTSFESLPAGWVCSVCGAGKDLFEANSGVPGSCSIMGMGRSLSHFEE